jgi:hypothetical protein
VCVERVPALVFDAFNGQNAYMRRNPALSLGHARLVRSLASPWLKVALYIRRISSSHLCAFWSCTSMYTPCKVLVAS